MLFFVSGVSCLRVTLFLQKEKRHLETENPREEKKQRRPFSDTRKTCAYSYNRDKKNRDLYFTSKNSRGIPQDPICEKENGESFVLYKAETDPQKRVAGHPGFRAGWANTLFFRPGPDSVSGVLHTKNKLSAHPARNPKVPIDPREGGGLACIKDTTLASVLFTHWFVQDPTEIFGGEL